MFSFVAYFDLFSFDLVKKVAIYRTILSPAYDLLSTYPYGDKEMALHMEGKKSKIKYKDILTFSKRHGIEARVIDSMVLTMKNEIPKAVNEITTIALDDKKSKALAQVILERIESF